MGRLNERQELETKYRTYLTQNKGEIIMKINKDSWHYKFISKMQGTHKLDKYCNDSCEYLSMFFKSCIYVLFLLVITSLSVSLIGVPIGELIAACVHGFIPECFSVVSKVVLAIISAIVLFCTVMFVLGCLYELQTSISNSFVVQSYDRIKNKFCSKPEFIEKE